MEGERERDQKDQNKFPGERIMEKEREREKTKDRK